jgi:hypothetical protein
VNIRLNTDAIPQNFPTHRHSPEFWECLGRAVATYGFLEETMGKAIFVLTGTRQYPPTEIEDAYQKWVPVITHALTDTLNPLILSYEKGLRDHPAVQQDNYKDLITHLKTCVETRNVLCHGSWGSPDMNGYSKPLFVDRKLRQFDSMIDCAYLRKVQEHIAELACLVVNSITENGLSFPGIPVVK